MEFLPEDPILAAADEACMTAEERERINKMAEEMEEDENVIYISLLTSQKCHYCPDSLTEGYKLDGIQGKPIVCENCYKHIVHNDNQCENCFRWFDFALSEHNDREMCWECIRDNPEVF